LYNSYGHLKSVVLRQNHL